MWRSLEPFKQDIEVHELSKDNIEAVGKFGGGGLQKFKHKELLVDLSTLGMAVQEFYQHDDRDYKLFEYEKPLVPKQVHAKLLWPMKKIHEWYYLACVYVLNFIEAHIPRNIFKTSDFEVETDSRVVLSCMWPMKKIHEWYYLMMIVTAIELQTGNSI
jgi:hypothetical protein